jgi:LacI family transcriptional regulator
MTVQELAKLAKVSPATISLVLNNKKGVSDETRKRVQGLIKKYNYSLPVKSRVPLKNIRFKVQRPWHDSRRQWRLYNFHNRRNRKRARNYGYNLSITTAGGDFEDAVACSRRAIGWDHHFGY